MTTKQLRDRLNKLMEETPNTADDEIYFYNPFDLLPIDKVDIHFDLYLDDARYIVIE